MKTASPTMIALLASGLPVFRANLYTISLLNGTTLYYSGEDYAITNGTNTWVPTGPALTLKSWNLTNTSDVPEMVVEFLANNSSYSGGANIKTLIHNGLFQGASILLQRAYMPTPGDVSAGFIPIFGGVVSTIQLTASGASITFRGNNSKFLTFMPRNRYMLGCIHALYDVNCKVSRLPNTFAFNIASASARTINWTVDSTHGRYANLVQGTFTILSGAGAGQMRTVESTNSAGVTLSYPLFVIPTVGLGFEVSFGCDRTQNGSQGCAFFNNQQNYRGFPFIPPVETAT